jgi:putative Holliday junction resolvase
VTMRPGSRLAVDVGRARVGIARSDPEGLMAVPVETVPRESALEAIGHLVAEYRPLEVVVGLPISLAGHNTPSTDDATEFAEQLQRTLACPVRLIDERLSTVSAMAGLHQAGKTTKKAKPVIDQVSAVIILQHCLDAEKAQGKPPGRLVGKDVND